MWDDAQNDLLARGLETALRRRGIGANAEEDRGPWLREYSGRELEFARDVLGYEYAPGLPYVSLWNAQRACVEELFEHRRVAVRGSRKCGKSETLGGAIIPTFMSIEPSVVLLLAPTVEQAKDIIWAKTVSRFNTAKRRLPGRMLKESWRVTEECYAKIIAAKTPENVRGYHAGTRPPIDFDLTDEQLAEIEAAVAASSSSGRRLLIAIDEAQAIPEDTYRVLEGMTAGENVYVYIQANPYLGIDDDLAFVRAHRPESSYRTIKVCCVSDAEVVRRGGRPDPLQADRVFDRVPRELVPEEWIETQFRQFGLEDSFILSDVLGRFLTGTTEDLVIPRQALEAALEYEERPRKLGPRIGVDLGFSHDSCVAVLVMHGRVVALYEWLPDRDDREAQRSIAGKIEELMHVWGQQIGKAYPDDWNGQPISGGRVSIDDSGLVGVCDILFGDGIQVDRVAFGAGEEGQWIDVVGDMRFKNVRAEMYWSARRLLQEGIAQVPRGDRYYQLWRQAAWVHFEREAGEHGPLVKIEPKEKIKERHGRSPDHLDAFVLALRETPSDASVAAAWDVRTGGLVTPSAASTRVDPPGGRRVGGRWRPGRDWQ